MAMASGAPRTERGRRTRERILQAAAELVAERGAAGVSLDDVGSRAAASRSQLYHYFEDRDDLIRAVVAATCDAVLDGQDELLEQLDSWAGIERWMDALVAMQLERQARGGCPLGSLAGQLAERDPQVRAALEDGFERWEQRVRAGLEALLERGELSTDAHPAELAQATMALLQGGLLLTQVRRDPGQLRAALDATLGMLRAASASDDRAQAPRRSQTRA
jgi:TetR/AcrR family transcriptional regulator, transcriptional repressor for nem operon